MADTPYGLTTDASLSSGTQDAGRHVARGEPEEMRKVVAYELLSLDGVAEQPDKFVTDFDEVMRENLRRVIATQDAGLLGRRTYYDWAGFWPTSDIEPFASFIK